MSAEIHGLTELLSEFAKLDKNLKKGIVDSIEEAADEVKRIAIQDIRITSAGKTATRYNDKRSVIVSKRGDAPNSDTEELEGSLETHIDKRTLSGFVFTDLMYGFWLETFHNRPFLQPALVKSKKFLKDTLLKNLKIAVRKAGINN